LLCFPQRNAGGGVAQWQVRNSDADRVFWFLLDARWKSTAYTARHETISIGLDYDTA